MQNLVLRKLNTMRNFYQPIIGLEIHLQVKTKSKMFCGCSADIWQATPNTRGCPVCLGLPGALPVPNQKAIELTQLTALALNCQLAVKSKFDRKHYFYPDLPKGYQISQYDQPLAVNGKLNLESQISNLKTNSKFKIQNSKEIRIRRVHLEEDTAKSSHQKDSTLIDFNKSGIPLMEIVTEPDLATAEEAVAVGKTIQHLARWIGVSEANMAKGQMRIELNVSMQKSENRTQRLRSAKEKSELSVTSYQLPNYKVEVKNINSFRYLKKIIDFEIQRQTNLLKQGQSPKQETRGWNENGRTIAQRFKETAADYRYFPEPDIPPLVFDQFYLDKLTNQLPELREAAMVRLLKTDKLSFGEAALLTTGRETLAYYDELKRRLADPVQATKTIINQPELVKKYSDPQDLAEYLRKKQTEIIGDKERLAPLVDEVLSENPSIAADYQGGKKAASQALIGKLMAKTSGRANPQLSQKLLLEKLKLLS